MISALVGFVAVLRHHGIPVGTDRTVAASRALTAIDLADPVATRRALRITLVGRRNDEAQFDELFDRWFDGALLAELPGGTTLPALPGESPAHRPTPSDTIDLVFDTERPLHEAGYVDDPSEQVALTTDASVTTSSRAAAVAGSQGHRVSTQVDATTGVGEHVGDISGVAPAEHASPGNGAVTLPEHEGSDLGDDELIGALDRIAAVHWSQLVTDRPHTPQLHGRIRSVLANPFDGDERRALDRIVRVLRPQLAGTDGWRSRPGVTGELDLRRTLRAAAGTAGRPARLRYRAAAPTRASVLVLIDTSLSVRPTARLMLHLAHALRATAGRVRVFAFIDQCVDVTDVVRHADLAAALGNLLDDAPGGVLDPARTSDYGAALRSLWSSHADLLRPTTTVIVLGDGRSNGRNPEVPLVEAFTARCRRTVWLTPEPRGAWAFGHGEMASYAVAVDVAATVRTLADLSALADARVCAAVR